MKRKSLKGQWTRRALAVLVAFTMLFSGVAIPPVTASAEAKSPYQVGSDLGDLVSIMQNYGFVAFDMLDTRGHQHMNAIAGEYSSNGMGASELCLRDGYDASTTYIRKFEDLNGMVKIGYGKDSLVVGEGYEITGTGEHFINKTGKNEKYKIENAGASGGKVWAESATEKYIDLENLQKNFVKYNQQLKRNEEEVQTASGLTLTNDGNFTVNYGSNAAYYTIDGNNYGKINQDATISFSKNSTAVVVFNIDLASIEGGWNRKPFRLMVDGKEASCGEDVYGTNVNRIYYNFYDSSKKESNCQYTGKINMTDRGWGTIIAPKASVEVGSNFCGVIIADNIIATGESHRANAYNPVKPDENDKTEVEKDPTDTKEKITLTTDLTHVGASDKTAGPVKGEDVSVTLTPDKGYQFTGDITVEVEDKEKGTVTYTIDPDTGEVTGGDIIVEHEKDPKQPVKVTVPGKNVTGDIKVTAKATRSITVTKYLTKVDDSNETAYPAVEKEYTVTLTPKKNAKYSEDIKVQIGKDEYTIDKDNGTVTGKGSAGITFDLKAGKLTISAKSVTDDITIIAIAKEVEDTIKVTKELTNVTASDGSEDTITKKNKEYKTTLTPSDGMAFTELEVTIKDGDATNTYNINPATGKVKKSNSQAADIKITYGDDSADKAKSPVTVTLPSNAVVGDVNIKAVAKDIIKVDIIIDGEPKDNVPPITKGEKYDAVIDPGEGRELTSLSVEVGTEAYDIDINDGTVKNRKTGDKVTDNSITYDPETYEVHLDGTVTQADVTIRATTKRKGITIEQYLDGSQIDLNGNEEGKSKKLNLNNKFTTKVEAGEGKELKSLTVKIGTEVYTIDLENGQAKDKSNKTYNSIEFNNSTGELILNENATTADIRIEAWTMESVSVEVIIDGESISYEQTEKGKGHTADVVPQNNKPLAELSVTIGENEYNVDVTTGKATDKDGNENPDITYDSVSKKVTLKGNATNDDAVIKAITNIQVTQYLDRKIVEGPKEIKTNAGYTTTVSAGSGRTLEKLEVTIGNKEYTVDLTSGKATDKSGNEKTGIKFDKIDKATGKLEFKENVLSYDTIIYAYTDTPINVKVLIDEEEVPNVPDITKGEEYEANILPENGKPITSLSVEIGDDKYDVDVTTGDVTKDGQPVPDSGITYYPDNDNLLHLDSDITKADVTVNASTEDPITVEVLIDDKPVPNVPPITKGEKYEATITPEPGKELTGLTVTVGDDEYTVDLTTGKAKDKNGKENPGITFDPKTGKLTLSPDVTTDDVKIKATTKDSITVDVLVDGKEVPNVPPITKGEKYEATITPEPGKELTGLTVTVGTDEYDVDLTTGKAKDKNGKENPGITYDPATGKLTLSADVTKADVVIKATTKDNAEAIKVEKKFSKVTGSDETPNPTKGQDYVITLKPKKKYGIATLTVKIGKTTYTVNPETGVATDSKGKKVDISYSKSTGLLKVPGKMVTDDMVITAKAVISKVPILKMNKRINVGSKFKVDIVGISKSAALLTYRSSNKKVATISKKGLIKGKKKGKCKIYADVVQGGTFYSVRIKLTVKKDTNKIYSLTKKALSKKVKGNKLPEFNVYKRVFKNKKTNIKFINVEKKAKITYKSSKPSVATVKKKGKIGVVYGKKQGFTVITCKIKQNGKTYITRVFVRVDDYKENKQLPKYLYEIKK